MSAVLPQYPGVEELLRNMIEKRMGVVGVYGPATDLFNFLKLNLSSADQEMLKTVEEFLQGAHDTISAYGED
jgi:hypothetical protein